MDLALFDFDSTITTRDTFADFIRFAAPRRRRAWGGPLLAPLALGYRLGWVSGHAIRASAVRVGLAGMPAARARAHGRRFADQVLARILRPQAMARIDWHRARGDRVVVVSGALELYLAPWCEAHGLEWLCSRLDECQGRLTGRYLGEQCVADAKVARVRAAIDTEGYRAIHAYGDSPDDHAMLRLAQHAHYRWQPWVDPEAAPSTSLRPDGGSPGRRRA